MPSGLLRSFLRRRDGTAAIIFGLMVVPLLTFAGSAFDYTGATRLRARLQAAVDGSVLQLCQAKASASNAELKRMAEATIHSFVSDENLTVDNPTVSNNPRRVSITARATHETSFMRLVSIEKMDVSATAACEAPIAFFEIALALDTTGSMATSDGKMTKISALKKAAKDFVAYMFDTADLADKTKISIVPFAASVAVDPTAYRNATWIDQTGASPRHWQNVGLTKASANANGFNTRFDIFDKLKSSVSAWGWAGCLESGTYPFNVEDRKPSGANELFLPMFAPDEAGDGGDYSTSETVRHNNVNRTYRYYAVNSYLDDSTTDSGCRATDLPTAEDAREQARVSRACKYKKPTGRVSTSDRGPGYMCTARPLTTLSTSKSSLSAEIDKFTAEGNTNIHEGIMWAWRTISPNSVFTSASNPPKAYGAENNNKIIVLMSDGMNTWGTNSSLAAYSDLGSYYTAYGFFANADGSDASARMPASQKTVTNESQSRKAMDDLTREACRNARNAGVTIYTIGFSIPKDPIDAQGLQLLRDCAGTQGSPGSKDHAFVANNSDSLVAVFKEIALGITQLRISR